MQEDYLLRRIYLVMISYAINLSLIMAFTTFSSDAASKSLMFLLITIIAVKFLFMLSIYINDLKLFIVIKAILLLIMIGMFLLMNTSLVRQICSLTTFYMFYSVALA